MRLCAYISEKKNWDALIESAGALNRANTENKKKTLLFFYKNILSYVHLLQ